MNLSQRSTLIGPSPTLAAAARARALKAQGKDVVSLAAGEPDFDTPDFVKVAAIRAIEEGFTKYTNTTGIPELKDAIVHKTRADLGGTWAPEQVIVSCGAKHALYNLFQALLDPGDEVIVLAPYWVSYPDMVRLAGGTPVFVDTRSGDGYALDAEAVRKALTPRTRAIVLNSPSNPTGAVYAREQIASLGEVLLGAPGVLAVSDDIYSGILYEGRTFENVLTVAPDLAQHTVIVHGCSKSWSMTGWRIGWAVGPKDLVAAMGRIQDQSTSNPSSISQRAAVAALTGPKDTLGMMVRAFDERRRFVIERLRAIPGVKCADPGGAFYAFPDVSAALGRPYKGGPHLATSARFCDALLEDELVSCVPGGPFGGEGHVRLSFATSLEQLDKGLGRIARFVASLG